MTKQFGEKLSSWGVVVLTNMEDTDPDKHGREILKVLVGTTGDALKK